MREDKTENLMTGSGSGYEVLPEEEIQGLRARIRRELEEEQQREEEAQRQRQALPSGRAQRVREIEKEEEERCYTERGYRRFVDRVGTVKWLSPEQYAKWEEEKVKHQQRRHDPRHHLGSRKVRKTVILVMAGLAIVLLMYFLAQLRRG